MGQKSLRILLTSFQTIFSAEVMPHIKENEEKNRFIFLKIKQELYHYHHQYLHLVYLFTQLKKK